MGRLARRAPTRPVLAALALTVGLLVAGCASRPERGVVHVLRAGETLYRLSRYYDVPVATIARANGIRDVTSIPVGTRLVIPRAKRAPPAHAIATVPRPSRGRSDLRNRARREASLEFGWPIHGKLSSGFGWRGGRRHEGIDIAARAGTRIRAAEAGRVILSGKLGDYGRIVIIKHAGHYSSVYAHNRRNRVKQGAFVEKGDVIGEVGSSGNATGPHLHFEIRRDRRPTDPLQYLR
jgi:murein DD-endopeptidase MepM/ murein hydrolase activator NlpD